MADEEELYNIFLEGEHEEETEEEGTPLDPSSHPLLNRKVIWETSSRNLIIGKITQAHLSSGTWTFTAEFDTGSREEKVLSNEEVQLSLIPVVNSNNSMHSTLHWKVLKAKYIHLQKSIEEGTCDAMSEPLLQALFVYRPNTNITKQNLKIKWNQLQKIIHPDKCRNEPPQVKFVAAALNQGLRYILETRIAHLEGMFTATGFSAPTIEDFPAYGSEAFCTAAMTLSENLTPPSDPPTPSPNLILTPIQPPAPVNHELAPAPAAPAAPPSRFDPHGMDAPEAPDPSFDHLPNTMECVLAFHLDDFFVNDFFQPTFVPNGCSQPWAIAFQKITSSLNEAIVDTSSDQDRKLAIASRWYGGAPQIFFRGTGKDTEKTSVAIRRRLIAFNKGDYSNLIKHWRVDIDKKKAKNRHPKPDTKARTMEYGISLIQKGRISRGISIIESNGRASISDPAVLQQMLDKHPQATCSKRLRRSMS
mmetsp:Transcript_23203/g.27297  ORF Transcript_23203/g.27297 Transcript_23203/m.27297 type:complete len:475 (-) Transcript_23203:740-2164(-)